MAQLISIIQSEVFWVAVGSVAAVCAIIVQLAQGRKRKKRRSRSDQKRLIEQATEAANRFHYWMHNYIHHGEKSGRQKLIDWLAADDGYAQVAEDYEVFMKMAAILQERGYKTRPPPTEAEFLTAVRKARAREL